MPVGNDIVDLQDPANQPDAIHPRFDRRVFAPAELTALDRCAEENETHGVRWTMWAAKEAALKCLRQADPELPFHPRDFVSDVTSVDRAVVTWHGYTLDVGLDRTAERVHAIATSGDPVAASGLLSCVLVRQNGEPEAEGAARIRAWCVSRVAETLSMAVEDVHLSPPGKSPLASGAPRVSSTGRRLPVEVSLSHDGRWHAAAVRFGSVLDELPT